jgi:hypothetical protein
MRLEKKPEPAQRAPQIMTGAARTSAVIFPTLSVLMLAAGAAMAQAPGAEAPSPASSASSPPSNAAAPQPQSAVGAFGGWVQQGGAWMQQGVANMGAGFGQVVGAIGGQASQVTKDAAAAARNAAASVSKLPNTGIAAGSERCVIAPNGAPDCRVAAETLCRAKGYAGGTSVNSISVENCPPPWRTSRRNAPEGVCTMEHYVTKALCQ